MKYVALLSGGKDSCFNLIHCHENGHQLVAAASLRPEPGKDEIDSYMYQTVGQDAVELVAKALDVPLYRRVISGDAVQQGSEYGSRAGHDSGVKGDETEDLHELLVQVLEHHPDVQGVSVGAILSNYQRVRVEHVCRRLGLIPLSYLWQRDQAELFSEMIEAGLTAVLIKVAGIGLTPKHLGKTLAEMQPTLTKLNSLYGLHVCGEGGEYETLTIDCPLFKSRIVLEEIETVIHSDNDFATVAYLRVKKGALEPKPDIVQGALSIPPLLEDPYIDLEATLKGSHIEFSSPREWTGSFPSQLPPSSHKRGNWVAVSNVHRSVPLGAPAADLPISEEVEECFSILKNELQSHGLLLEHCANINVFISPMSLFAEVNKAYTRFFGTSPPARACVATSLPWPIRVRMDVIAHAEEKASNRQALHVQGLSYWAPANIGPYSQVILASEQLFVSGQIGLTPRDLTLANSFPLQAALTHQHVARVIKAVSETTGSWDGFPQLVLYWMDKAMNPSNVLLESETLTPRVPSLSIVVDSLPKNAQVEKQVLFHTGRCEIIDEEGEAVVETKMPAFSEAKIDCSRGGVIKVEKLVNGDNSFATVICAKGDISGNAESVLSEILTTSPLSARIFYTPSPGSLEIQKVLQKHLTMPATQIFCRDISTKDGLHWDHAIIFYSP